MWRTTTSSCRLSRRGKRVKFADGYLIDSAEELQLHRFKSVTTVMALTVPRTIATAEDLANNNAVYQDITRETIQERYPDIPVISPSERPSISSISRSSTT